MRLGTDCLTKPVFIMGVICIDQRVWTSLVGRLKSRTVEARRVQRLFNPKTSDS